MRSYSRRGFIGSALALGGVALTPLEALVAPTIGRGYGPLAPVPDDETGLVLLDLPEGFSYRTFGWTGDPLDDGTPTPPRHDGMAAIRVSDERIRLVRNHEITHDGGAFATDVPTYDPAASGGTVTLELDAKTGALLHARPSLAGTLTNCCGGPTPWGAWLSCEENVSGPRDTPSFDERLGRITRPHGYVFEVPADADTDAEPLRAMGRFVHEATAVDPGTGIVYETEDRHECALYRFVPTVPGDLVKGGRLQALAIRGGPRFDTRKGQVQGRSFPVEWVDVEDPDPEEPAGPDGVFQQARRNGAATFRRLEGAWFGAGRLYFVSTDGGDAGFGQVWRLDPLESRVTLVFESPNRGVLEYPDNVTRSPRGGLVLCEDGRAVQLLYGLTPEGEVFHFARNRVLLTGEKGFADDYTGKEFAGATFDPAGRWLFVNIQEPGITFAITGPWERGPL